MRGRSLVVLLAAAACSSRNVRSPELRDGGRSGVVKYQYSRVPSIDEKRRKNAEQKMARACAGPYRILSERTRNDGAIVNKGASKGGQVQPIAYRYIEYACDSGA